MKKVKILVTSVGSLVGKNIHDVLECPMYSRRENIELVGTNSIPDNPNNFRCDRCYIVSSTNTPEFKENLAQILLSEKPDLILCGRDEDTETIAVLLENHKELPGKLPYGKFDSLCYGLDKWETWKFCEKYKLPFASTFIFGKSGGLEEFEVFVEKHEYPLIAKPIQGFASKGVYFVRNREEALIISEFKDYMFQEYLGCGSSLEKYFEQISRLTPLFAHSPDIYFNSCYTVINPDGSFAPIFISRNEHNAGASVGFKKVENPDLEKIATDFINAYYAEGGYGPFNVQFRQDKFGNYKAQEINLRTTGNTFAKFLLGQDDIGLIMNGILPELDFPVYTIGDEAKHYIIAKSLYSYVMRPKEIAELKEEKRWNVVGRVS